MDFMDLSKSVLLHRLRRFFLCIELPVALKTEI